MKVTLEITMYPLSDGYKMAVKDFLRRLNSHSKIEVITNGVSTQVFREFEDVMAAFTESLKVSMETETTIAVACKIINVHLPPDRRDDTRWK